MYLVFCFFVFVFVLQGLIVTFELLVIELQNLQFQRKKRRENSLLKIGRLKCYMMEIVLYACERFIFVSITINKCSCFVHNYIILMLYSQSVNLVSCHSLIESFALCCYLSFQVNMLQEKNKSYGTIKFVDIGSDDYSPDENQGLDYQTVSPFSMVSS